MITKWGEKRKIEKGRAVRTGMVNKTIIALSGGLFLLTVVGPKPSSC